MIKDEFERKWLLRHTNHDVLNNPDEKLNITQIYYKDIDGTVKRIRYSFNVMTGEDTFEHIIKDRQTDGYNTETEVNSASMEEYERIYDSKEYKDKRIISKQRQKYHVDELVYEVDTFSGFSVLEIETPTKDYDINIIPELKEKIVLEVTQFKEFSNYSLAEEIN